MDEHTPLRDSDLPREGWKVVGNALGTNIIFVHLWRDLPRDHSTFELSLCLRGFPGYNIRMNVGVAHSEVNPNTRVMNSRGIWLAYLLLVTVLHVVLLSIPVLTVPLVWTLTNVIHNLVMYLFLHTVKGTPFETPDQGKARLLTHWEQMDYGIQFTSSRKFLTISPIVLYILASFYTKYDATHFLVNTGSLLSVLLPKLPLFHGVRIFGINSRETVFQVLKSGLLQCFSELLQGTLRLLLPLFLELFSVSSADEALASSVELA
ncbi:hypothetical protein J4Q44_G00215480 [Coregonus suidteri]|uniref:ORM1-like protein 2 n=1 Tax=Coregonus suidteri TaxID=861788 RepID=A0AAN8LGV9_9TELE